MSRTNIRKSPRVCDIWIRGRGHKTSLWAARSNPEACLTACLHSDGLAMQRSNRLDLQHLPVRLLARLKQNETTAKRLYLRRL
eukprot:4331145-Pleurochrysis_carterae.AAC.4